MNSYSVQSTINHVLEWIMHVAYINILWIAFTLLGLVVFGWMPATIAMYATWRRRLLYKDQHMSIFRTFMEEYKSNFIKKNITGLIMMMSGLLIFFYYIFYQQTDGVVTIIYSGFLFFVIVLFVSLLIYLPPVIVHFNLSFWQYFKMAIYITLRSPLTTILFYIGIVAWLMILYKFSALFLPFGVSVLALFVMKGCLHRFRVLGF